MIPVRMLLHSNCATVFGLGFFYFGKKLKNGEIVVDL